MDIVTFRTFLAAASTGSFAAAAQRVNASPSAVTERIKQLEFRLGARLFERSKKGCELTPAGIRFMGPAAQVIRAWEYGQHEAALPEEIKGSFAFGCQYALWTLVVKPWFKTISKDHPDIAFRASTGSPVRLNRDMADGILDMAILYDPVYRNNIVLEELFRDKLILVTATPDIPWRENYVRFRWGQGIGAKIALKLGTMPGAGLILDLGLQAIAWMIDEKSSGYVPARLCQAEIAAGNLYHVADSPEFDFPAYICWRTGVDGDIAKPLIESAKKFINGG